MLCRYLSRMFFLGVFCLTIQLNSISGQAPDSGSYVGDAAPAEPLRTEFYKVDQNGSTESEIDDLNSLLKTSPADPIVHNNIGVVYFHLGRLEDAYSAVSKAVELNDRMIATQLNLSMISQRLGYRKISLTAAAMAVKLEPSNRKARQYMCLLKLIYSMDKEALACYQSYAKAFSPAPEIKTNVAEVLYRVGNLREARQILEDILKVEPRDIVASNILGKTYFGLKKYKNGVKVLKNAVEISPDQPELRFNLAMCYLALKNRPAVLSQYRLLKTQSPKLAQRLYSDMYKPYVVDARKYPD